MAQLVSASGLGPEGPVFESQYPDKIHRQLLEIQVVAFFIAMHFALQNKIGNFDHSGGRSRFKTDYDTGKRNRKVIWHS